MNLLYLLQEIDAGVDNARRWAPKHVSIAGTTREDIGDVPGRHENVFVDQPTRTHPGETGMIMHLNAADCANSMAQRRTCFRTRSYQRPLPASSISPFRIGMTGRPSLPPRFDSFSACFSFPLPPDRSLGPGPEEITDPW